MLKRLRVGNFRNLVNVDFRPAGLNLLIGPNNVGKTSLCSALRFLSLTSSSDLETAAREAVGEPWNIPNAYVKERTLEFELAATLHDGRDSLEFEYSLTLSAERTGTGRGPILLVEKEQLLVTGGAFTHVSLITCANGKVHLLHEPGKRDIETTAPPEATMLSRLYDLETNQRANLFKSYLQSWLYYNLNPQSLRNPKVASDRPTIKADGANLTKAMFALHNEDPRTERAIIESLKMVEPKIDLFTYGNPDPESIYLFLEDSERNRFGTHSMSDGTLRFLAFAYLVHTLAEKADGPGFSPVVMFEEPENGLYVSLLRALVSKLEPDGSRGQFIFSSHSPYFIDLFEKNLVGVHLFKPGKPSSVLSRLDEKRVNTILEQMSLGELHFREMLA